MVMNKQIHAKADAADYACLERIHHVVQHCQLSPVGRFNQAEIISTPDSQGELMDTNTFENWMCVMLYDEHVKGKGRWTWGDKLVVCWLLCVRCI